MRSFQGTLREAKRPVALAGAGLSAASGIPTFRGAGVPRALVLLPILPFLGLWRQHDALSLATPEAFRRDPSKVWQFYHYRRTVCLNAKPNPAHLVLAKLLASSTATDDNASTPNLLKQVMPQAESFHLITQNVDGLSGRAMAEVLGALPDAAAASQDHLLEMHGNLFKTVCTRCGHGEMNYADPIAPALQGSEDLSTTYRDIPLQDLPRCQQQTQQGRSDGVVSRCNGLLRPGVAWFGESIPDLDRLETILEGCDLILVLGTSSIVYPAAGFAEQVKQNRSVRPGGGMVAVLNIDDPPPKSHDSHVDWYFQGPVEETLPMILGLKD
ncbi:hypothetical protein ACQY0O_003550 [Thecaphora frezii]